MLNGRAHQLVDELFWHHLARECLRDFDHRREIELFDRCFDRSHWARRALVLLPRMELIELPHLSVGSPSKIGSPCASQIETRNLREATRCVKTGSQLVRQRL